MRTIALKVLFFAILAAPFPGFVLHSLLVERRAGEVAVALEDALAERAQSLRERLLGISEGAYSLKALYDSSEEVNHREFATFTGQMRDRMPAIQAVEWVPRVTAADRAAHEAAAREAGLASYGLRELSPDGRLVPARSRETHHPVRFVEPYSGNERILGFDLASEATRLRALTQAARCQDVVFSDPVKLVQESGSCPGILAFLAIRERSEELDGRRGEVTVGFALLVVPIEDLVEWAWPADSGGGAIGLDLRLTDMDVDGGPILLWRTLPGERRSARSATESSRVIFVGRQQWELRGRPRPGFLVDYRTSEPVTTGIAFSVLWAMVFGSLFLLARLVRGRVLRRQSVVVRSVLGNLSEGVMVADGRGAVLYANPAAGAMLGNGGSPLSGTDAESAPMLLRPDLNTPYRREELPLQRAISGERVEQEQVFLRNDQAPGGRWLSISGAPLRDGRGDLLGGVALVRDITREKDSEEALRMLSNAVEQTADVVMITTRAGLIQYVNPAFGATFGYSGEEVLGKSPRILKSGRHDRDYYEALWETILAGKVHRARTVNRKKNGELIHVEQTVTPMKDESGEVTHFVSVYKDFTERLRNEEQETELRTAAAVQTRLFPKVSPRLDGLDLWGAAIPAAANSGDYFDYIHLPDGKWVIAIGDVSGHGLGPALIMVETRAYLRSLLQVESEPDRVLQRLNAILCEDVESGTFITLMIVHVDPSERTFHYASAGHHPAMLLDGSGELESELGPTGPGLAMIPEAVYRASPPIELGPGAVLVLLTDGITEARSPSGAFLGEDGALEILQSHRHGSAKEIVERLCQTARHFSEPDPVEDDITAVVLKAEL